jgi:Flp pilus assembly protein TadB
MILAACLSAALLALAVGGRGNPAAARLRRLKRLEGAERRFPDQSGALGRSGFLDGSVRRFRPSLRLRANATREAAAELALLVDLLSAALAAGAPLASALEAVDRALPEPRHHPLARVRDVALSGSLDALTDADEVPAVLLRALRRSSRSGSRLAVQLRLLADDTRAEAAGAALDRARRVGVLAVLPLGLCCLPAFMLLAVVPLAAGLLRNTLA